MADLNGDPGDTVEVEFEVKNSGDTQGEQDILLRRSNGDTVTVDRIDDITLDVDDSDTNTLVWEEAEEGEWELCVESDDTSDCISVALTEIPVSGLLHRYQVDETATTSQIDDLESDLDLTGSVSDIETDGIDDNDIARFDGSGDLMDANRSSAVEQPYDYYLVAKMRSIDDSNRTYIADASAGSRNVALTNDVNGEWELIVNGSPYGSGVSGDSDYHLFHVEIRDDAFALRLDDSEILSDNDTVGDFDGITVGGRAGGSGEAPLDFAESLWYDADGDGYDRSEVVSYISGEYPSLSI